jgi:hypothetical protein
MIFTWPSYPRKIFCGVKSFVDDLVGLNHVRVVEARGNLRFGQRHGPEGLVLSQVGPQHFEDDQLVEVRRSSSDGKVDVGHPALAELQEDPVLRDWASLGRFGCSRVHLRVRVPGGATWPTPPGCADSPAAA